MPAKPIRLRFEESTAARLLNLRWWDWPEEKIRRAITAIREGSVEALDAEALF